MKKLLIALMLLLSFTAVQAQVSATAEVSANVQSELTLVKDADIDFGNISATSTPILDPKDVSHTDVGQGYTVGEFTIGGSSGAGVNVAHDATVTLGDGAGNTMTYTPVIYGHEDTQSSSSLVTNGGDVVLGASGYKLWVGGNLGTLSNQAVGQYTATAGNGSGAFTITLEYN